MGIGDWGLGIGDWAQSPIPNPQSPIPNFINKNNLPLNELINKKEIIKLLNIDLYINETFDDLNSLISEFMKKEPEIKIKG